MNTRDYKQSGIDEFYHIYNRGNSKKDIFINDEDYKFFLLRLRQNLFPETYKMDRYNRIQPLPSNSFTLLSYCLMPNHFHLLLKQNKDIPPGKLMLKVCTSYSKFFNKKYEHVGHVFQDRFRQVLIGDDNYLSWLMAYIHQNPKVAGIVKDLSEYPWSSFSSYLEDRNDGLCDRTIINDQFKSRNDLLKFIDSSYEIVKSNKNKEELLLD